MKKTKLEQQLMQRLMFILKLISAKKAITKNIHVFVVDLKKKKNQRQDYVFLRLISSNKMFFINSFL